MGELQNVLNNLLLSVSYVHNAGLHVLEIAITCSMAKDVVEVI